MTMSTSIRRTKLLGPFVIGFPIEIRWHVAEVANHRQTFGTWRKRRVRKRAIFTFEIEKNKNGGRQNGKSI